MFVPLFVTKTKVVAGKMGKKPATWLERSPKMMHMVFSERMNRGYYSRVNRGRISLPLCVGQAAFVLNVCLVTELTFLNNGHQRTC